MSFRRYTAAVLVLYVGLGAAIIRLGLNAAPYVGDLTRMGGYTEAAVGWRAPQQRFVPPLYTTDHFLPDADVLVLGDSMSLHRPEEQTDPGTYWPNWLAAETGWKIVALSRYQYSVEDVLALPAYRAHPPKLLVLEFAERTITGLDRLTETAQLRYHCDAPPAIAAAVPLLPAPVITAAAAQSFDEPEPPRPLLDLSLGGHRLKHILMRNFMPSQVEAVPFKLDRADLFSSRQSQTLLAYRDDLLKIGMSQAQLSADACGLVALKREVEADGHTRFVVLVVPDKLSAYQPYVQDFPKAYPSVIPALAQRTELLLPRIDVAFATALEDGTRDLFLPNDTHIGVVGHRIVSKTLLRELEQRGFVAGVH